MIHDDLRFEIRLLEDGDYVEAASALSQVGGEIERRGATPRILLRKAYLEIGARNFAQAIEAAQGALAKDPSMHEAQLTLARALFYSALVRAGVMEGAPGAATGNPGADILAAYRHVSDYLVAVSDNPYAERLCSYLDDVVLGNRTSFLMAAQLRRDFAPTLHA